MKRFIAILLAFLCLGTNLGFSFGVHYCGGRVAEAKLLVSNHDLGCGMETDLDTCDQPIGNTISKKSCCQNQVKSLLLEEEAKLSNKKWDISSTAFTILQEADIVELDIHEELVTKNYSLNRLRPNLQVLFQSFLI